MAEGGAVEVVDDAASTCSSSASTTTVSTIAVKSGGTRIVIALLQSEEQLQLKIQEMTPSMTDIGHSLEEAKVLHAQHEAVLEKLNAKQSPVEELLKHADELIAEQNPKSEVYQAMAANLATAWRDLSGQLDQRKLILEQAVKFHTKANEFSERLTRVEMEFSESFIPHEAAFCKNLQKRLQDARRGILESSKDILDEGRQLLELIRPLGVHSMGDARSDQMKAASQDTIQRVEDQIEQLQSKKREVEVLFQQRELILQQSLQKCTIEDEIKVIQNWLSSRGSNYKTQTLLGDTLMNCKMLIEEHTQRESEAKEIRDKALKLVKTAEQVSAQGHFAAAGLKDSTYAVLESLTDVLTFLEERQQRLKNAESFFTQTHEASQQLNKIDQENKKTRKPPGELKSLISQATEATIKCGKAIVASCEQDTEASRGIKKNLEDLENKCNKMLEEHGSVSEETDTYEPIETLSEPHPVPQQAVLTVHQPVSQAQPSDLNSSEAYASILERLKQVHQWSSSTVEPFLQAHKDFGDNSASVNEFLENHRKKQGDVQTKDLDVGSILLSIEATSPTLAENEAEDLRAQMEQLKQHWSQLKKYFEIRINLAQRYMQLLKQSTQLAHDMDEVEQSLKQEREGVDEKYLREVKERWLKVQQSIVQFNHNAKNFADDASKIEDSYLDIKRIVLTAENQIDNYSRRRDSIKLLLEAWDESAAPMSPLKTTQWESVLKDSQKSRDSANKIVNDLFPAIPKELNRAETIAQYLERHMDSLLPLVRTVQSELDMRAKAANTAPTDDESRKAEQQLLIDTQSRLENKVEQYENVVKKMVDVLKNITKLEKEIDKCESSGRTTVSTDPRTLQTDLDLSVQNVKALEAEIKTQLANLIANIDKVEPEEAAQRDKDKIKALVQAKCKQFESLVEQQRSKLKQIGELQMFNKDLQEINLQLKELVDQLNNLKSVFGESVVAAKTASHVITQFESTIQLIQTRVDEFVTAGHQLINANHSESNRVRREMETLQNKWQQFQRQTEDSKKLINATIEYLTTVDQVEEWHTKASQMLVTISKRISTCRKQQEINSAKIDLDNFVAQGQKSQEERLQKLQQLSLQMQTLKPSSTTHLQELIDKSRELLESFKAVSDELSKLAETAEEHSGSDGLAAGSSAFMSRSVHVESSISTVTTASSFQKVVRVGDDVSPPEFIEPLVDAEVEEGAKHTFQCRVSGQPTPNMQWYKDGILISNNPDYKTNFDIPTGYCQLTIEETMADDSAIFTCKAINTAGMADTKGCLTVKESQSQMEPTPPEFTETPKSVHVVEGQPMSLRCVVKGNPTPVVAWYKDEMLITGLPDFRIETKGSVSELHAIYPANQTHVGLYSCSAENAAGQTIADVTIRVVPREACEPAQIREPLKSTSVPAGNVLKLKCVIAGEPEPQVAWTHNGKVVKDGRDIKLSLVDNVATLDIVEAFPKHSGLYGILVSNAAGECASHCTITVTPKHLPETSDSEIHSDLEVVSPKVKKALVDQTVNVGTVVRMNCVIVGQPEPEVIWYHETTPIKESPEIRLHFEGDECVLIIHKVQPHNIGTYRCVARNTGGEATTRCRLNVVLFGAPSEETQQRAPQIVKELENINAVLGEKIKLMVKVEAYPEPEITWQYRGKPAKADCDHHFDSYGNAYIMTIPEASFEHSGRYSVTASNFLGTTTSSSVVQVFPDNKSIVPLPTSGLTNQSSTIVQKTTFSSLDGKGQLRQETSTEVHGYQKLGNLPPQEYHTIERSEETKKIDGNNQLDYEPRLAPKQVVAAFQDSRPPRFLRPLDSRVLPEGSPLRLDAVFEGKPDPNILWTFDGSQIPIDFGAKLESDTGKASLIIDAVTAKHTGRFACVISNLLGTSASSADLIVRVHQEPPNFIRRIEPRVVRAGERVEFTVEVVGLPQPDVSWFRNGIPAQNSATFRISQQGNIYQILIPEAFPEDSCRITCVASNPVGEVRSTADLIVQDPSSPTQIGLMGYSPGQEAYATSPYQESISAHPGTSIPSSSVPRETQRAVEQRIRFQQEERPLVIDGLHLPVPATTQLSPTPTFNARLPEGAPVASDCRLSPLPTFNARNLASPQQPTFSVSSSIHRPIPVAPQWQPEHRDLCKPLWETTSKRSEMSPVFGRRWDPNRSINPLVRREVSPENEPRSEIVQDPFPSVSQIRKFHEKQVVYSELDFPRQQKIRPYVAPSMDYSTPYQPICFQSKPNNLINQDSITSSPYSSVHYEPVGPSTWESTYAPPQIFPNFIQEHKMPQPIAPNTFQPKTLKQRWPPRQSPADDWNDRPAFCKDPNLRIYQPAFQRSTFDQQNDTPQHNIQVPVSEMSRCHTGRGSNVATQRTISPTRLAQGSQLKPISDATLPRGFRGYSPTPNEVFEKKPDIHFNCPPPATLYRPSDFQQKEKAPRPLSTPDFAYQMQVKTYPEENNFSSAYEPINGGSWSPYNTLPRKKNLDENWRQRRNSIESTTTPPVIYGEAKPLKPIIKREQPPIWQPKSKKAVVIEEPPVQAKPVQAPIFMQSLVDTMAKERQRVCLQCVVVGSPVPTIRWFKEGNPIGASSTDHQITHSNGVCRLILPEVFAQDAGHYQCVATNSGGNATNECQLFVGGFESPPIGCIGRPFWGVSSSSL